MQGREEIKLEYKVQVKFWIDLIISELHRSITLLYIWCWQEIDRFYYRREQKISYFLKEDKFKEEKKHDLHYLILPIRTELFVSVCMCRVIVVMENKRVESSGYLWWGGRLIQIYAAQVELQVKDSVGLDPTAML